MILTHIFRSLRVAAAAMAVAAMSACSGPTGEIQEPSAFNRPNFTSGITFRAGFYITVGELANDTGSRTTPAGEYNPGQGIENYIDLDNGNIRVFLYTTENAFISELTEINITPVETYESSKLYFISGATQSDISSGKFKIMVVANWPDYPGTETPAMDDFFKITFDFDGTQPSRDLPIPMYAVKEINLSKIEPDQSTNLGTIHLLRALAKIEVIFDTPADEWILTDLKLTHYNTSGFCAPEVRSQSDYVKDDWDRDYVGRPFIPSATQRADNLDFINTSPGHYVLYVPEYSNTTPNEQRAQISAKVAFGTLDWAEHLIDIKNGTKSTDIMRNIWYKITIKKIEKSNIDITVDVIPYAVCDLDPIFGLS